VWGAKCLGGKKARGREGDKREGKRLRRAIEERKKEEEEEEEEERDKNAHDRLRSWREEVDVAAQVKSQDNDRSSIIRVRSSFLLPPYLTSAKLEQKVQLHFELASSADGMEKEVRFLKQERKKELESMPPLLIPLAMLSCRWLSRAVLDQRSDS